MPHFTQRHLCDQKIFATVAPMKSFNCQKRHSLILVLCLLLSPLFASASDVLNIVSDSVAESTSCPNMGMSMNTGMDMGNLKQPDASMDQCCEDPCQCSDMGCHAPSAAVNSKSTGYSVSSYQIDFTRHHYLSVVSNPSSPPPIV